MNNLTQIVVNQPHQMSATQNQQNSEALPNIVLNSPNLNNSNNKKTPSKQSYKGPLGNATVPMQQP